MTASFSEDHNWQVTSDFGRVAAEGSLDPLSQGAGGAITFFVQQETYTLKTVFVRIDPVSGSHSDFWDDYWSNQVGGEPADAFALSSFLSFSADGDTGSATVWLNADDQAEGVEHFNFSVYESNIDAALNRAPLVQFSFSIRDDDRNGTGRNDTITGGKHADHIRGFKGSDTIEGRGGQDRLFGHDGDDSLSGGGGADRINGGRGDDILAGGGKPDVFVFQREFGNDTILDFETAGKKEKIDLSGVSTIRSFLDLKRNHISEVDSDTVISDNKGNDITLLNVSMDDLKANDFIF